MKQANEKDEALDRLFDSFVSEEEFPPASVTDAARQALREEKVRVAVKEQSLVAVAAAEGAEGGSQRESRFRAPKYLWYIAAAFILCIAAIVLAVMLGNHGEMKKAGTLSSDMEISYSMVARVETEFGDGQSAIMPFVEIQTVTECAEYVLAEDIDGYAAGSTVVWYAAFSFEENVSARLYVEAEDVSLDALESYKYLDAFYTVGGIEFSCRADAESESSQLYFMRGGYSYNLLLSTSSEVVLKSIADFIAQSFA